MVDTTSGAITASVKVDTAPFKASMEALVTSAKTACNSIQTAFNSLDLKTGIRQSLNAIKRNIKDMKADMDRMKENMNMDKTASSVNGVNNELTKLKDNANIAGRTASNSLNQIGKANATVVKSLVEGQKLSNTQSKRLEGNLRSIDKSLTSMGVSGSKVSKEFNNNLSGMSKRTAMLKANMDIYNSNAWDIMNFGKSNKDMDKFLKKYQTVKKSVEGTSKSNLYNTFLGSMSNKELADWTNLVSGTLKKSVADFKKDGSAISSELGKSVAQSEKLVASQGRRAKMIENIAEMSKKIPGKPFELIDAKSTNKALKDIEGINTSVDKTGMKTSRVKGTLKGIGTGELKTIEKQTRRLYDYSNKYGKNILSAGKFAGTTGVGGLASSDLAQIKAYEDNTKKLQQQQKQRRKMELSNYKRSRLDQINASREQRVLQRQAMAEQLRIQKQGEKSLYKRNRYSDILNSKEQQKAMLQQKKEMTARQGYIDNIVKQAKKLNMGKIKIEGVGEFNTDVLKSAKGTNTFRQALQKLETDALRNTSSGLRKTNTEVKNFSTYSETAMKNASKMQERFNNALTGVTGKNAGVQGVASLANNSKYNQAYTATMRQQQRSMQQQDMWIKRITKGLSELNGQKVHIKGFGEVNTDLLKTKTGLSSLYNQFKKYDSLSLAGFNNQIRNMIMGAKEGTTAFRTMFEQLEAVQKYQAKYPNAGKYGMKAQYGNNLKGLTNTQILAEYSKVEAQIPKIISKLNRLNSINIRLPGLAGAYQQMLKLEGGADKVANSLRKMSSASLYNFGNGIQTMGNNMQTVANNMAKMEKENQKANKTMSESGSTAQSASKGMNILAKAGNLVRRALSGIFVIWGFNFGMELIEVGKNAMDSANAIRQLGKDMSWTSQQSQSFIDKMKSVQQAYPKIDINETGKQVAEMARTYKLTNKQATDLIKTSAVFNSAMAREGRTTRDASLALKDYLDGGTGWKRRMQEIGATPERLQEMGWSGDEKDTTGKIKALDKYLQSRGYDVMAQKIYTLDDAYKALQNSIGSLLGSMGEGLTPAIISAVQAIIQMIGGLKQLGDWLTHDDFGKFTFSGLKMIAMMVVAYATTIKLKQGFATLVTSLKGMFTMLKTNPFALSIAGAVALTYAIYKLGQSMGWWKNWQDILRQLSESWNNLMNGKITMNPGTAFVGLTASLFTALNVIKLLRVTGVSSFGAIGTKVAQLSGKIRKLVAESTLLEGVLSFGGAGKGKAGKAGAKGAEKAVGEVASTGLLFGRYGTQLAEGQTATQLFKANLSAMGASLAGLIPAILEVTAVIAVVIACIFALAGEVVLLMKGLQMLIASMHFEQINLKPSLQAMATLNKFLWELAGAVTAMSITAVFSIILQPIMALVNYFHTLEATFAELQQSVQYINQFANIQTIDSKAITALTNVAKGLDALNTAVKSLGGIGSEVAWQGFWEALKLKAPNQETLSTVHADLSKSIPAVNSFKDMQNIDQNAVKKITDVAKAVKSINEAMKALGSMGSDVAWSNGWQTLRLEADLPTTLSTMHDTLWDTAEELAKLKDMPSIPNGLGGKLQRVIWTLNNVRNIASQLKGGKITVPENILSDFDVTAYTIRELSAKLRDMGTISNIPSETSNKLNRTMWALSPLRGVITALNNSGIGKINPNVMDGIDTTMKTIRDLADKLRNMSTISNIPSETSAKLQRVGWITATAKNTINTIKGVKFNVPENLLDNADNAFRTIRNLSIKLRDMATIANIPPEANVKIRSVGTATSAINGVVSKVLTLQGKLAGFDTSTAQTMYTKLQILRRTLLQIVNFNNSLGSVNTGGDKQGGNNGASNASGIVQLANNIATAIQRCVSTVNSFNGQMNTAGWSIGNSLRTGVTNGVRGTGAIVRGEMNAVSSATNIGRTASDNLGGAFGNLRSTTSSLVSTVNSLATAINNLPSSKSIGITLNVSQKGNASAGLMDKVGVSGLPTGTYTATTGGVSGAIYSASSILSSWLGFAGLKKGHVKGRFAGFAGTNNSGSSFDSVAQAIMANSQYQYYYNSKNGGNVEDSLRSGAFNCYDGSLILMALASMYGLKSEMRGMMINGDGHAYTVINGKVYDATAMQTMGRRKAPGVRYAGTGGGKKKEKEKAPTNNYTVEVQINGDVYGEKDLEAKIKKGVEKALISLINPSKGTGM